MQVAFKLFFFLIITFFLSKLNAGNELSISNKISQIKSICNFSDILNLERKIYLLPAKVKNAYFMLPR